MTITTPAASRSLLAAIVSVSLPLIVNINNPSSAISGLIGGATAATVVYKSRSRRKEEEFTLSVDYEVSLVAEEKVVEEGSVLRLQDFSLLEAQSNERALITLLEEKGIEVIKHRQDREGDELLDSIADYLGKRYSILEKLHSKIKASKKSKAALNIVTSYIELLYYLTTITISATNLFVEQCNFVAISFSF